MTPLDRKILVMTSAHGTVANLARHFSALLGREVRREELSMCLRGVREYPELQELLSAEFGIPVKQLFGKTRKAA